MAARRVLLLKCQHFKLLVTYFMFQMSGSRVSNSLRISAKEMFLFFIFHIHQKIKNKRILKLFYGSPYIKAPSSSSGTIARVVNKELFVYRIAKMRKKASWWMWIYISSKSVSFTYINHIVRLKLPVFSYIS